MATGESSGGGLLGRDRELALVGRALDALDAGSGGGLLIVGEPGIGKTALAAHALGQAGDRGWTVLAGNALGLQSPVAYGPLVQALGSHLHGLAPADQAVLVDGLPALGRLFEGLGVEPPAPVGDADLERSRLFQAVSLLIDRLTRQAPVVWLVDDLQWADPASVELLHHLTGQITALPLLLVVTCRSGEVADRPDLRGLLAALRGEATTMIEPGRLDRELVAAMAVRLLDGEVSPELVDLVTERSAGTPLFVDELVRDLRERSSVVRAGSRWRLADDVDVRTPPLIEEVVARRLDGLDAGRRRIVDALAIGGVVEHDVLRSVTSLDDELMTEAMVALGRAGLIHESVDGQELRYSLAHPVTAEVARRALPETARRELHREHVTALEAKGDPPLERLARHLLGAGPLTSTARAVDVLAAAGQRALDQVADDAAARYFGAALRLVRDGPHRPGREASLLEGLGRALERRFEVDAAGEVLAEALDRHRAEGDRVAVIRVAGHLSFVEWLRGRTDDMVRWSDEAVEAAGERTPELLAVRLDRLGMFGRAGRYADYEREAERVRDLATLLGTAEARACGAFAEGQLLVQQLTSLTRARDLFEGALTGAAHAPGLELRITEWLLDVSLALGDWTAVEVHRTRAEGLHRARGTMASNWREPYARFHRHLAAGRGDDVADVLTEMAVETRRLRIRRQRSDQPAAAAVVAVLRGRFADAEDLLARSASAGSDPDAPVDRPARDLRDAATAWLAAERGDAAGAEAVAARLTDTGWVAMFGLWPHRALAELHAAAGRIDDAVAVADRLDGLAGPDDMPHAIAQRIRGLALAAVDPSAAQTAWRDAAACFAALGMPFERARAEVAAAVSADDRAEERRALACALTAFDDLGAEAAAVAARERLAALGAAVPPPRGRDPASLTPRETEVADLVAEGLTNGEIAERLFVSIRTVTSHLDHIYTKLGIGTRTALARHVLGA